MLDNFGRCGYRIDKIEHAVLKKMKAELADAVYLKEYLRVYFEERRALVRETVCNRSAIENELSKTKGRLARLVELYA